MPDLCFTGLRELNKIPDSKYSKLLESLDITGLKMGK